MSEPIFTIPPDWEWDPNEQFPHSDNVPFMWHRHDELLEAFENAGITGEGLKIGIIDTGYSPHPWLPKPAGVRNFTPSGRGADDVTARNPHGQHVFGIIGGLHGIGLLPKAEYYIAKGLGDGGSGSSTGLNRCIRWLADQGCHFINGSYGGGGGSNDDIDAAEYFYNKGGLLIHFAAGNAGAGRNTIGYPARHHRCSCNGSYDRNGDRSNFSSTGPQVDGLGAGGGIVSTMPPTPSQPNRMGTMSGTSMGCPDFLGKIGGIHQARRAAGFPDIVGYKAWHKEYKRLFDLDLIRDLGPQGRDNNNGWGRLITAKIIESINNPSENF